MDRQKVNLVSPHGYLKHRIKNNTPGEVIAWDLHSGKPLVRFQLEEIQVVVAVPVHWMRPAVSHWSVVERDGLPEVR